MAFRSETMTFHIFINPLLLKLKLKMLKFKNINFELRTVVTSATIELESCFKKQNVGNFLLFKKAPANLCSIFNRFRDMTS